MRVNKTPLLPPEQKIVRADAVLRRKALIILTCVVVFGLAFFGLLLPLALKGLARLRPDQARFLVGAVLILMFLSFVPAALYLFGLGRTVLRESLFPPPGMKVIKDTPLLEGPEAQLRGIAFLFIALFIFLMALIGALYTYYLVQKLAGR